MLRTSYAVVLVALFAACAWSPVARAQRNDEDSPLARRRQYMTASGSVRYGPHDAYQARGEFADVFAEARLSLASVPRGPDEPYRFEITVKNNGAARYFYNPWFRAAVGDAALNLLVLLGWSLVFFTIGMLRFQKRFA